MVMRMSGALFAIDPARITAYIVLLLPDGHSVFNFVDYVATRLEGFIAMASANANPNRQIAYLEFADAVYTDGLLDRILLCGFGNDSATLF